MSEHRQSQRRAQTQADTSKQDILQSVVGSSQPYTKPNKKRQKLVVPQCHPHSIDLSDDISVIQLAEEEEAAMLQTIKYYENKFAESCKLNDGRRTNPEEEELLVSVVIRFALFHNTKEPGIPIARLKITEVLKDALPACGGRHWLSSHIICRVQTEMASTMGMELKQISPDKFVLQSLLPRSILNAVVHDRNDDTLRGFILLVLAIIKLSGERMERDGLWEQLTKFGLERNDVLYEVDSFQSIIQGMIRKKYLREEKQHTVDGNVVLYELGEAIKPLQLESDMGNEDLGNQPEISLQELDDFIDQIFKGADVHHVSAHVEVNQDMGDDEENDDDDFE